jgi:hypothetical protein
MDIVPSDYAHIYEGFIVVRNDLVKVHGYSSNTICFESVYFLLFTREEYFINKIAEYWPFIVKEDGQFLSHQEISKILHQIIKEENLPKSANKI